MEEEKEKDTGEVIYITEFARSMQGIAAAEPAKRYRAVDGVLFKDLWVVATNGSMIAIAPKGEGDGLDNIVIKFGHASGLELDGVRAYERTDHDAHVLVPLTGPDAGFPTAVIRAEGDETRKAYPDFLRLVRDIVTSPDTRTVRLTIDARMLNQLARVLTMSCPTRVVTLEITPEEDGTTTKPVIVAAGITGERGIEPCGLIMPCDQDAGDAGPREVLEALLNWDGDWEKATEPITDKPDENWPLEI